MSNKMECELEALKYDFYNIQSELELLKNELILIKEKLKIE
jgi:hypothetical protein